MSVAQGLARLIDGVRIHRVWREEIDGRSCVFKRRRALMGAVIACGNLFLRLSRSRIVMFPFTEHWQAWELHCFDLLNGDRFGSGAHGPRTIWMEPVPGTSLSDLMDQDALDPTILACAGAEMARAHHHVSKACDGPWSHGDPHLENLLYDPGEQRVRLIDFETAHEDRLDPIARHADDLLVLLLDLAGRIGGEMLTRYAGALLDGYDLRAVRPTLRARLVCPAGLELVLWHTRTRFLPEETLAERIELLKEVV